MKGNKMDNNENLTIEHKGYIISADIDDNYGNVDIINFTVAIPKLKYVLEFERGY